MGVTQKHYGHFFFSPSPKKWHTDRDRSTFFFIIIIAFENVETATAVSGPLMALHLDGETFLDLEGEEVRKRRARDLKLSVKRDASHI